MSSKIRRSYDNDECWEYSYLSGRYTCQCEEEDCNVYVGAAGEVQSMFALVATASALVTIYALRGGQRLFWASFV